MLGARAALSSNFEAKNSAKTHLKANITNTGVYTCVRLSRVDGSDSREILSRIKMGWEIWAKLNDNGIQFIFLLGGGLDTFTFPIGFTYFEPVN